MKKIKLQKRSELTIQEAYEEFRSYCKARNYSGFTITYYDNTTHIFGLFHPLTNHVGSIDKKLVDNYLIYLQKKKLAGKTINTYFSGLKTVLNFFMSRDYILSFTINKPKYDKPLKEIYTDAELKLLLIKPDLKKCSFAEYRNWVLINYFIATGQRKNTVLNLKIGDLDLKNDLVTLRVVKNRKPGILPLSTTITAILKQYLTFRKGTVDDYLFCNSTGGQMTSSSLTCAIREYNRGRGVSTTSIHAFRHSFAKMYLMNGGNVFALQKLLMHSDITTTKEYLNLNIEDLQLNYDSYNPLDQLSGYKETIKL